MAERLWSYLVTHARHLPGAGWTGIGGVPLDSIIEGELAMWVSPLDIIPAREIETITAHNDVIVRATTPSITPVPVRFGQVAAEADLRSSLRDRAEHFSARLAEFSGAAEFGLRVTAVGAGAQNLHSGEFHTGREFLESLAAREQRAGVLAAAIRAELGPLVRREREDPPEGEVVARVAHLVGATDRAAYRAAVGRLAEMHEDYRFHSSGPWPPYSFAA